jgi:8-amino-7-oxononanoate synthase
LTKPWLREYLINYSRPLIYTTALAGYNIIAVHCSLDILESPIGRQVWSVTTMCCHQMLTVSFQLAARVLQLSAYFKSKMAVLLEKSPNAPVLLPRASVSSPQASSIGTQIMPLLTPHPRELSQYLREHCSILARPIMHPTVPKGEERVRVCIHANNTREEIDSLLDGVSAWIRSLRRASTDGEEVVARVPRSRL